MRFTKDLNLLVEIAERYEAFADHWCFQPYDRLSMFMDLEAVDESIGLDLVRLAQASDQNFIHDITGIKGNLNRDTKQLENQFTPRFAIHV